MPEKQFERQLLMKQENIGFVCFIEAFSFHSVTTFGSCSLMLLSLNRQHTHNSSKYKTFGTTVNLSHADLRLYVVNLKFRIHFTSQSKDK